MDPEQPITPEILAAMAEKISLREEVPQRLLYRALIWADQEINRLQGIVAAVRAAVEEPANQGGK